MSTEFETSNTYNELQIENKERKVRPACNCPHGWLITVYVMLFGVVCFAAGFVTSYFAVPSTGKVYRRLFTVIGRLQN